MYPKKLSAKIDTKLIKEKLGELEYHKCKVPTQYQQIQAMPLEKNRVETDKTKYSIKEVADFDLAV